MVIIGAGFGGLAAAVALRRKGIDDLTIIERADGVGGTWRQNIYPGAACDIQSHLYSFSFAPNRAWSRTYAYQPEILAYLETVADDFDLRRHLMLEHARAQACDGTADAPHWDVELDSGDVVVADVVVSAVGLFGAARYPDIDGLADFTGTLMHTAQWDATVDLTGKRVAVIGTGASGVQVVPEIADVADEVDGFPAHAAVDGAQGGPAFQRRRSCLDSASSRGRRGASGGGCGSCSTTTRRLTPDHPQTGRRSKQCPRDFCTSTSPTRSCAMR